MSKKRYIDLDKAVDIGYLGDWYQSSIDTTVPPIWTDEHLEELCKDFIVIPKDTALADVEEVRHGKWIKREKEGGIFANYECSVCSAYPTGGIRSYCCPNCGAKMRGEAK